jgi:hypothetical protein
MGKRKAQTASSDVEQAIGRLRTMFDLGRRARSELRNGNRSGYGRLKAFATDAKCSPGYVHNAIRFHELYEIKFDSLCQAIRSAGYPLGTGHIAELIQLYPGRAKERAVLLQQTLKKKWSTRHLREVRTARRTDRRKQDQARGHQRGRKPRRPESVEVAYARLADQATSFTRLAEVIAEKSPHGQQLGLSRKVKKSLQSAVRAMQEMQEAILSCGSRG